MLAKKGVTGGDEESLAAEKGVPDCSKQGASDHDREIMSGYWKDTVSECCCKEKHNVADCCEARYVQSLYGLHIQSRSLGIYSEAYE